MNKNFITKEFWTNSWKDHYLKYISAPARTGIWLKSKFGNKKLKILEIAGGPGRDSIYLCRSGYSNVTCSDFNDEMIKKLSEHNVGEPLKFSTQDAMSFQYRDDSFDITFHNGFWICFSNDSDLIKLIAEQTRVTKNKIIGIVHNGKNKKNVEKFKARSKKDSLYDIRFFEIEEIKQIIMSSHIPIENIEIQKFGGMFDALYKRTIKRMPNIFYKLAPFIVPRLYRFQSWENTERIAVIVNLKK